MDLNDYEAIPGWILAFRDSPQDALTDIFTGRYYNQRANPVDPDDLILDWIWALPADLLAEPLDIAIAEWIREHWNGDDQQLHPADVAWLRCLRVVALADNHHFSTSVSLLLSLVTEATFRLNALTTNRVRDVLGWYWACISRNQQDDSLRSLWFRLCNIPPGVPAFHGHWGLLGLRRVPGDDNGGFRVSVALGLERYLIGLDARVSEGSLRQRDAERMAVSESTDLARSFPFPARWSGFWAQRDNLPARVNKWLRSVFSLENTGPGRSRSVAKSLPPPRRNRDWPDRARVIASDARSGNRASLKSAIQLTSEQRDYAIATGDFYSLVRTLCNLSGAFRSYRPQVSLAFATEAGEWEPWNPYVWTSLMQAQRALGEMENAIAVGYYSLDRFPFDGVIRNELAEVLKAGGDLDGAEAQYRETVKQFPDNVVSRNGLAEVLKAKDDLDGAEAQYRETVKQFPDNVVSRNGLAEVLKAKGDLDGAEAQYRETVKQFPDNVVSRSGLAEVLKAKGDLDGAEAQYRETVKQFPDNVFSRNGLAEVLKAKGDLDGAEAQYRETVKQFPDNVFSRNGLAEVLKAKGDLDGAEAQYRETVKQFPGDVASRNGLAEVLKAKGDLDGAEAQYRETVKQFPDNVFSRNGLAEVLKAKGDLDGAEAQYRETVKLPGDDSPNESWTDKNLEEIGDQTKADEKVWEDEQRASPSNSIDGPLTTATEASTAGVVEEGNGSAATRVQRPALTADSVSQLRGNLRRAMSLMPQNRTSALDNVIDAANDLLARLPTHVDGIYTKAEALIAGAKPAQALDEVLNLLPDYVASRPDFLALRARAKLTIILQSDSPSFDRQRIDEIVLPWSQAAKAQKDLRAAQAVAELRASAAMTDGYALDEVRLSAAEKVNAMLQTTPATEPDESVGRRLNLWYRERVKAAVGESLVSADSNLLEVVSTLRNQADLLDVLEDELVSAARYTFSVTP